MPFLRPPTFLCPRANVVISLPEHPGATDAARRQPGRPSIVHSSLYLPEPVYEALRKIAFDERLKIHDIVLEGIDLALQRRGYPSVESLKAGKKR